MLANVMSKCLSMGFTSVPQQTPQAVYIDLEPDWERVGLPGAVPQHLALGGTGADVDQLDRCHDLIDVRQHRCEPGKRILIRGAGVGVHEGRRARHVPGPQRILHALPHGLQPGVHRRRIGRVHDGDDGVDASVSVTHPQARQVYARLRVGEGELRNGGSFRIGRPIAVTDDGTPIAEAMA